jgi:hypothetical protein
MAHLFSAPSIASSSDRSGVWPSGCHGASVVRRLPAQWDCCCTVLWFDPLGINRAAIRSAAARSPSVVASA